MSNDVEFLLSRRAFLKRAGLTIAFSASLPKSRLFAQDAPAATFEPNAFLHISNDNSILVLLAHSEMGQGQWTTLPMLIAEELDVDVERIKVEHAPAADAYKAPGGGWQGTVGSGSTRTEFDRYRMAGATARVMLVQAASQRLGVPVSALRTEDGHVIQGERKIPYGDLVHDASQLSSPDPKSIVLRPAAQWKLIGKGARRLDSPEKITGKAKFGMDVQFEGLLTALVARPPQFGGKVKSFDPAPALAIPGVRKVVQVSSGVAVIADHFWAAKLGRDALIVEWDPGPGPNLSMEDLVTQFRALTQTPGTVGVEKGDAKNALRTAHQVIRAEYIVPYLAHAPMEPLNCTVRIEPDRCDLWLGTQMQTLSQQTAAQVTGLNPEQIHVHTMFLGGGFGRRAVQDFTKEAVEVAKAANAPVKTVWTREDDIRGGMYRAAYVQRIEVGLDEDGIPISWDHSIAGQSIFGNPDRADGTTVEGVVDSPYVLRAPAYRVDVHSPKTTFPVWFWRSVGHSFNGFVMESMVDELAYAAGIGPVAYRRLLLKDEPKYLAALDLAVEKFGWNKKPPAGHAYGFAIHEAFGTIVAEAVEVSIQNASIRVHRVVCAVNCGIAVNPGNIAAQMEGSIVFGLTAALYGKLTLRNGMVEESNFHDYKMLRISEMPQVSVHIVPGSGTVGGIGEPGTPPIAPAVANALYVLTGTRQRQLPLRLPQTEAKTTLRSAANKLSVFFLALFLLSTLSGCGNRNLVEGMPSELQRMPTTGSAHIADLLTESNGDLESRVASKDPVKPSREEALRAFAVVNRVFQHPRCSNCHIPGDQPLQFDAQTPHAMNVVRGIDGNGSQALHCSTCHGTANLPASYGPHAPPGAPNWRLPPADRKMGWIGRPPNQVCALLKNKQTNGNRDFAALIEHVSNDKVVLWGWEPGGTRAPVPVSHDEFVTAFKTWVAAGGPCPTRQ
jgi:isoquinoline 1-oxidoreductase beta subunit